MTYNAFSGMLNLTQQSTKATRRPENEDRHNWTAVVIVIDLRNEDEEEKIAALVLFSYSCCCVIFTPFSCAITNLAHFS